MILNKNTNINRDLTMSLQDADAPFPHAFGESGMPVIKWIVTIGAIFALCTSLLGAMFPLPRVLYAMGMDGVLFRPLSNIHKRTKTPVLATILSGLFTGEKIQSLFRSCNMHKKIKKTPNVTSYIRYRNLYNCNCLLLS